MFANTFNFKKNLKSDEIFIYLLFISAFLPFYITIAVIFASTFFLFALRKISVKDFSAFPFLLFPLFTIYTVIVAIINKNYIGIICSIAFLCLICIAKFAVCLTDEKILEKSMLICTLCGVITAIITFGDFAYFRLVSGKTEKYRATLYFFNCNYLATIFAIVIIICAYKFLNGNGNKFFYLFSAIICVAAMYLTGSMFVWIDVFFGIAALLLLSRRHQLVGVLLLALGTVCIVLYCVPEFIPRFSDFDDTIDNRLLIWNVTSKAIKQNPLFGGGFLTYYNIYKNFSGSYPTTHSHNIILEPILSFGIIGTAILLVALILYFRRVIICRNAQNKLKYSSLILALLCALVAHSTTDLTFMWVQTGLLYCLLMGFIGPEEKLLCISDNK